MGKQAVSSVQKEYRQNRSEGQAKCCDCSNYRKAIVASILHYSFWDGATRLLQLHNAC